MGKQKIKKMYNKKKYMVLNIASVLLLISMSLDFLTLTNELFVFDTVTLQTLEVKGCIWAFICVFSQTFHIKKAKEKLMKSTTLLTFVLFIYTYISIFDVMREDGIIFEFHAGFYLYLIASILFLISLFMKNEFGLEQYGEPQVINDINRVEIQPIMQQTAQPTVQPTMHQTTQPTVLPTMQQPAQSTVQPTMQQPTQPTVQPTINNNNNSQNNGFEW